MQDLSIIIPCAGNSSRFNSNIPKPLAEFKGKAFINYLLSILSEIFKEIVIPIQPGAQNKKIFLSLIDAKFHEKINLVESEAGRGDAGAIIDGYNYISSQKTHFFVCWGDTYFVDPNIFKELIYDAALDDYSADAYVPLIQSKNPYVSYSLEGNNIKDALLSIDGHFVQEGLEDQSIFLLSHKLMKTLNSFDQKQKSEARKKEISLLRFFKYAAAMNHRLVGVTRNLKATLSFNTQEELSKILKSNSLKEN